MSPSLLMLNKFLMLHLTSSMTCSSNLPSPFLPLRFDVLKVLLSNILFRITKPNCAGHPPHIQYVLLTRSLSVDGVLAWVAGTIGTGRIELAEDVEEKTDVIGRLETDVVRTPKLDVIGRTTEVGVVGKTPTGVVGWLAAAPAGVIGWMAAAPSGIVRWMAAAPVVVVGWMPAGVGRSWMDATGRSRLDASGFDHAVGFLKIAQKLLGKF